MTDDTQRPDVKRILKGLKDFQRHTVDYVFRRMYTDPDQTRRFLIADEVGLGKTLVARGVIARVIEHLWDHVGRIDVVYICSNADIARQNINRLNVTDQADFALASRITLLPTHIRNLTGNKLNFVSFTPGTSFDLKSSMGMAEERVLLYWLLQRAWGLRGAGALNVLQGTMNADRFRAWVRDFNDTVIDEALATAFVTRLDQAVEQASQQGRPDLHQRFDSLCDAISRSDRVISAETRQERSAWIGEVRALMASTCLQALEPDLIIMDEFQRFKHLLDADDEASQMARQLFDYSDAHSSARVILLSATPYKMYTLSHEEVEDHYQDFMQTLRFLLNDPAQTSQMEELITAYRHELLRLQEGDLAGLRSIKTALEAGLRKLMVRTERLAVSADRDGMLVEVPAAHLRLEPHDVQQYLGLARMAELIEHTGPIEYWKSAPYLLNLMDEYELKEDFEAALENPTLHAALAETLLAQRDLLLPVEDIARYARLDPGNARLRFLMEGTVDAGTWRLLWVPPSLPYYRLEGPFSDPELVRFTKRLVFSSWRVVPKAISILLSYEAERRMLALLDGKAENTEEARKRRRPLLRFARSEGRLTGMPVLGLIYPCATLGQICDPLLSGSALQVEGLPKLEALLGYLQKQIGQLIDRLPVEVQSSGPEDERWYWAAPILLDAALTAELTLQWFSQKDLASQWMGREDTNDDAETAWDEHVAEAETMLDEFMGGDLRLGPRPADLNLVLAQMGVAGLGVVGLRALARVSGGSNVLTHHAVRNYAAQVARSFLYLFNLPESTALIRGLDPKEPYWRRVLEYCAQGGLQSVMDEYVHVLRESLGLLDSPSDATASQIAGVVIDVLTYKTSTPDIDDIQLDPASKRISMSKRGMRGRFALRFGDEKAEDSAEPTRADRIRAAFNSPFWPFVLATTSVGQEGLDFHPYCHAVVHWNLPTNPVDLEQREGRVHRYKGHAVRRNLASQYPFSNTVNVMGSDTDIWATLFKLAKTDRSPHISDLVPYWVYPLGDGAKIERHVPALPLSRDHAQLGELRRSLAVYRMVFGQNRQEDLLAYLTTQLRPEQLERAMNEARVDLSPLLDVSTHYG